LPVFQENLKCLGVAESPAMVLAYAVYGWLSGRVVTLYGVKHPACPGFLERCLDLKEDCIASYEGQWFEINRYLVKESQYLDQMKIEKNVFLSFQRWWFGSAKVDRFYQQSLAGLEYRFLRDRILSGKTTEACSVFPWIRSYRYLARQHTSRGAFRFSPVLTGLFCLFGALGVLRKIAAGICLRPIIQARQKGLVLKQLSWGFKKTVLSDDMLVDEKNVRTEDMIYFAEKNSIKRDVRVVLEGAEVQNKKVVLLSREINVNECYFLHFKDVVLGGCIHLVVSLIFEPSLLFALSEFIERASNSYRLHSLAQGEYLWSMGNWHDIVETVVANRCGVRVFVYAWSDYAQCYLYTTVYTVQNDVFLWGPVQERFMFPAQGHDRVYAIGCLFARKAQVVDPDKIARQHGLSLDNPVVVFYDSPANETTRFSRGQCQDFWETVREYALRNPEQQVILKPKTVKDGHREFFAGTPVVLLGAQEIDLPEILVVSSLSVGMGILAPVTVSLMMGKPALFYDTSGNRISPFCADASLVVRSREDLFLQMEKALSSADVPRTIEALADYDVEEADPLEILRGYVKNGRVDERYQI